MKTEKKPCPLLRDSCGIDPEPENKQSELVSFHYYKDKAGNDSSYEEEKKGLLGDASEADLELEAKQHELQLINALFGDEAGVDSSHGEENKHLLGIGCSAWLEFQLDLAKCALEYYGKRKNDPVAIDDVQVFSACFLNSWPRMHSSRHKFTDKCHISFYAKIKENGLDDVSTKWFFVELLEADNGDFRPTMCEMMDPSDPGITYGCGYCPPEKKFPHPPRSGDHFERLQTPKLFNRQNAAGFKHHHRLAKTSGKSKCDKIMLKKNKWLSNVDVAKIALAYDDQLDGMYQVEEVVHLEKMPFSWVKIDGTNIWYHVVFTGRPRNSDASLRLLFGELRFCKATQHLEPTYCCVMETDSGGLSRGCGFCPPHEQLVHPAGGFRCGAWVDPPSIDFPESAAHVFFCTCGDDSGCPVYEMP